MNDAWNKGMCKKRNEKANTENAVVEDSFNAYLRNILTEIETSR